MRFARKAALAALFGLVLAAPALAKTKWDMSVVWPPGNFQTQDAEAFAKAVAKATHGDVEITVHPGGSLGIKGPEGMAAVRDGLVQMGEILMSQQVGNAPALGVETLPYLAPTMSDLALLHKFYRPKVDEIAAKMNQKVLYMVPWPGQAVYSKKPIKTLADLKGLKIRVVDANGESFFKALGAAPVQMPWGDVVPALAAGTIDAVTTSSSSGVDGSFWEFMKYMNTFNWQASSDILTVNLDDWKSISPKDQKAIVALGKEMEGQFWLNSFTQNKKDLAILKSHGMIITAPSPALKADLMAKAKPLWTAFEKRVPSAAPYIENYLTVRGD